jgi:hypothetical protein
LRFGGYFGLNVDFCLTFDEIVERKTKEKTKKRISTTSISPIVRVLKHNKIGGCASLLGLFDEEFDYSVIFKGFMMNNQNRFRETKNTINCGLESLEYKHKMAQLTPKRSENSLPIR